jgi:DNA-binding HxlR family transcriptional regulator
VLERTYPGQVCSIARSLEVVGERWTLLILRDAQLGLKRFDEFRGSLGIASNVLTARLERLCEEGLLERRAYQSRPDRHEYLLTDKGRELAPALIMLMKWGDRYYPEHTGPPRLTIHRDCGGRVDHTMRCSRCRRHVDFAELDVRPGPGLSAARSRGTPTPTPPPGLEAHRRHPG